MSDLYESGLERMSERYFGILELALVANLLNLIITLSWEHILPSLSAYLHLRFGK